MNTNITTQAMALIASAALTAGCAGHKYPAAPQDGTTDDYFGTTVADPYRPLENDTAEATLRWVDAERKVTEDYLAKIPFRAALRERIASYNDYEKQGTPCKGADGRNY